MLKDLDTSIRVGQHPALVCLLGICEEAAATLVVMEQGEPSLKQWLLDSRALDHQPQYAATHRRFTTAREEVTNTALPNLPKVLLDMVAGLASGLAHLEVCGITHGAICARNVVMTGDTGDSQPSTPCPGAKLGGFGMTTWSRPGEQPDCSRWLVGKIVFILNFMLHFRRVRFL